MGARLVVSGEASFFAESATQPARRSGKREEGSGKREKRDRRDLSIGGDANVIERQVDDSARS
jgi:hypothetical protein